MASAGGSSKAVDMPTQSASVERSRFLIPRFDGAILSQEKKEALWDKFVTG